MNTRTSEMPRRSRNYQEGGSNWILIAGGALLSALSIRLGYKLKQVVDTKQLHSSSRHLKGGKCDDSKNSESHHLHSHSNVSCFTQEEDGHYSHYNGSRNLVEIKEQCNGQMTTPDPEIALPLATVPPSEFNKEHGMMWSSSPDRLDPLHKPFLLSNSSESCVSEAGSDIFSKREVIQKLRQQLKRRDDMILEMQDQIAELQNSLSYQLSHSSHLQSLLNAANRDLFDSETEIQRLRKTIADQCVGPEKSSSKPVWLDEVRNGNTNGHLRVESSLESSEKRRGDGQKIEMFKREVSELKELIEGKDYLLKSYKEQKSELSVKIQELQHRLDSQLPNIL